MGKSSVIIPFTVLGYMKKSIANTRPYNNKSMIIMTTDVLVEDLYVNFIDRYHQQIFAYNKERIGLGQAEFKFYKFARI